MKNLTSIYYEQFLSLILEEYNDEFSNAKAGHCMKITGLAVSELKELYNKINAGYSNLTTYILSDEEKGEMFISATKLIELRNDLTFPLLILIPSNKIGRAHV